MLKSTKSGTESANGVGSASYLNPLMVEYFQSRALVLMSVSMIQMQTCK